MVASHLRTTCGKNNHFDLLWLVTSTVPLVWSILLLILIFELITTLRFKHAVLGTHLVYRLSRTVNQ